MGYRRLRIGKTNPLGMVVLVDKGRFVRYGKLRGGEIDVLSIVDLMSGQGRMTWCRGERGENMG